MTGRRKKKATFPLGHKITIMTHLLDYKKNERKKKYNNCQKKFPLVLLQEKMYSSSSADARASNQHLSRSEMTIFPTFPTCMHARRNINNN